jgi:hypothetical protein
VISAIWRASPAVVAVLLVAVLVTIRFGGAPTELTYGETATMSFPDGPPILVTVGALRIGRASRATPGDLVGDFTIAMRMARRGDVEMSGDAPASYCSVVDANGVEYPADLHLSSSPARHGIFSITSTATRSGRVVVLVPISAHVAGISCQLGVSVVAWRP